MRTSSRPDGMSRGVRAGEWPALEQVWEIRYVCVLRTGDWIGDIRSLLRGLGIYITVHRKGNGDGDGTELNAARIIL